MNLHAHTYVRLDGSTKPEQRQLLMQRFNSDSKIFAFILSTRRWGGGGRGGVRRELWWAGAGGDPVGASAILRRLQPFTMYTAPLSPTHRSGGVGMNLIGADTVIFYDSGALGRCVAVGVCVAVRCVRVWGGEGDRRLVGVLSAASVYALAAQTTPAPVPACRLEPGDGCTGAGPLPPHRPDPGGAHLPPGQVRARGVCSGRQGTGGGGRGVGGERRSVNCGGLTWRMRSLVLTGRCWHGLLPPPTPPGGPPPPRIAPPPPPTHTHTHTHTRAASTPLRKTS